jgi:hypothetical protein
VTEGALRDNACAPCLWMGSTFRWLELRWPKPERRGVVGSMRESKASGGGGVEKHKKASSVPFRSTLRSSRHLAAAADCSDVVIVSVNQSGGGGEGGDALQRTPIIKTESVVTAA